ncbi:MAG: hypothetical protein E7290_02140 [Lachnospiraceae bacterium]|nr:hypothetical protein [Lachnospiraceae bacterium]
MKGYGSVREKVIRCGRYGRKCDYIEVDIVPNIDNGRHKRSRRRKRNVSAPKQKSLNTKRAIRYLYQLIKSNFTDEDYRIDLTYSNKFRPRSEEEATRRVKNFVDRVNRERLKRGLPKAAYICIHEYGKKNGRIHHHMLISGGLDRQLMEALWCDRKRAGQAKRERLGTVNCDNLQFTDEGIEGLFRYITKDMRQEQLTEGQLTLEDLFSEKKVKGKRRWMQSKGLVRPWSMPPNDYKYSRRDVEKIVSMPPDCENVRKIFERIYDGYALDRCRYEFNEYLGRWSIYLSMHLIT